MPASASLLTIANAGWMDPRTLNVGALACSWAVDAPGDLSCETTRAAIRRTGISDLKGKWVRYEHAYAGRWAGVLTDTRPNTDGTTSLAASSLHWHLSAKRTSRTYQTGHSAAGVIAQRVLRDVATETTVWIGDIQADEDGALFAADTRGDDLIDVYDRLADQANQEYDLTVDDAGLITIEWRKRIGSDKTARVLLREGAEIGDVEVTESLATVVNDMLGVSDASDWPDAASAVAEDADSIASYGRRQATTTYQGADAQSLEAYAAADVAILAQPVRAFRAVMLARHPLVAEIRHGDIVRVWLKGANYAGTLRVTNRALDVDSGQLTIAGELGVDVA